MMLVGDFCLLSCRQNQSTSGFSITEILFENNPTVNTQPLSRLKGNSNGPHLHSFFHHLVSWQWHWTRASSPRGLSQSENRGSSFVLGLKHLKGLIKHL